MGMYEDIEDLDVFDVDNIVEDVCEWCFGEEFAHTAGCPLDPDNRFFDEEIIISGEIGEL